LQPATVQTELDRVVASGDSKKVNGDIYRARYSDAHGESHSATIEALRPYYHAKCAYCEARANLEVEHFRPIGSQQGHHKGYLWLCYEWTNLLPACHDCNTFAGGKGSKFAVLDNRQPNAPLRPGGGVDSTRNALTDPYLAGERPKLLHPELDDPDRFLDVKRAKMRDGFELHGRDRAKRGAYSISTYNLNRLPLRLERLTLLEDMVGDVDTVFQTLNEGIIPEKELPKALRVTFGKWEKAAADTHRTHTLVRRLAIGTVKTFQQLFIPLLPANQSAIVDLAFSSYKAGRL
jgi:hypothetical protein